MSRKKRFCWEIFDNWTKKRTCVPVTQYYDLILDWNFNNDCTNPRCSPYQFLLDSEISLNLNLSSRKYSHDLIASSSQFYYLVALPPELLQRFRIWLEELGLIDSEEVHDLTALTAPTAMMILAGIRKGAAVSLAILEKAKEMTNLREMPRLRMRIRTYRNSIMFLQYFSICKKCHKKHVWI